MAKPQETAKASTSSNVNEWALLFTVVAPLCGLLLLDWEPNLVLMFILVETYVFSIVATIRMAILVTWESERRWFINRVFEGLFFGAIQLVLLAAFAGLGAFAICAILGTDFTKWGVDHANAFFGTDEDTLRAYIIWPWIAAWRLRESAPGVFPIILLMTIYPFWGLLRELYRHRLSPDYARVSVVDKEVTRFLQIWVITLIGCVFVLPFLASQGEFFMRLLPWYSGQVLLIAAFLIIKALFHLAVISYERPRQGGTSGEYSSGLRRREVSGLHARHAFTSPNTKEH